MLVYQRAYDDAGQQPHPTLARIAAEDDSPIRRGAVGEADRTAVFVRRDCPACDQAAQRLQGAGTTLDTYVVGSRADDDHIRAWARQAGTDPAKVRAGQATLNHDAGRWLFLELPAVVRQTGSRWQRQP